MFYHLGTGSGEEEGSGVEEYQEAGGQDHRGLQIQLTAHLYQNITFKSALNLRNLRNLHISISKTTKLILLDSLLQEIFI